VGTLRRSYTAIVERGLPLAGSFETEPYEAGWASEAIFFVRLLESAPGIAIQAHIEISPDGMHWISEGTELGSFSADGLAFCRTVNFGNWLRLAGVVSGAAQIGAMVILALKE
jgi:hypothetical protein